MRRPDVATGAEQRQSRGQVASVGFPPCVRPYPAVRAWTPQGLQLCVWFKGWTAFWVLRVTSDLWPEGLAGQLSWTGTMRGSGFSSRLWFELRALDPEGETCSSCPYPRALGPFSSSPYPSALSPEG